MNCNLCYKQRRERDLRLNTSVCRVGKQQTSFFVITSRSGKIIFSLLVVNLYCHSIETTFINVCLVLLIYFFSILTFEYLVSFLLKFFHSERFFNFPFFIFLNRILIFLIFYLFYIQALFTCFMQDFLREIHLRTPLINVLLSLLDIKAELPFRKINMFKT